MSCHVSGTQMPDLNEIVKSLLSASRLPDAERIIVVQSLLKNVWSLSPSEMSMCLCVCSVVLSGNNENLVRSNVDLIWELVERSKHN